jgi:branched-chain amino acid transport system ATP-binding protein
MSVLLETRGLTKRFGGVAAVDGLDLAVNEGEILGLIGPNGAGKTTVFTMISGFAKPTSGDIVFEGKSLLGLPAWRVGQRGIARVFQHSILFSNVSVLENVLVGFHRNRHASLAGSVFGSKKARTEEAGVREQAAEIVTFVGLEPLKDEKALNLSHGHQRMLSVATALATGPRLLLLDEPVTGMNPVELQAMVGIIRAIRERGITIMLVEHHMKAVMDLSDRVVVLNYGQKIAEGAPAAVCEDAEVCAAYLGKGTFNVA